ncbi:MAG: VanW family protein [Lachnospiraceae bacterium]|nr:VanW family protein [Lachnospiraceae bacterium]
MKRKLGIQSILGVMLCVCLLFGSAMPAEAAQASLTKLTFDVDYYYNTYPDLQAAFGYDYNALYNHYLQYGLREGRSGSEEFNCFNYVNNYADLRAAYGGNYVAYCQHYEQFGKAENRNAAELLGEVVVSLDNVLLGSYSTSYDPTLSRATNVRVAAERINGVLLVPGQSFSFSDAVLPRTAENGYVLGEVIYAGEYTLGIGGGICQTSSTLYAAMVNAGLPATERYPHSKPVDYIPRDLESAIATGYKDLKFVNIYDKNLEIVATADDETGTLTVSLFLK